jgi:S1-C subfamily serine protease
LRLSSIPYCALAIACSLGAAGTARAEDFAGSVVRVRAIGADGSAKLGSGVVIGGERVATACHVTRHATTIEIAHGNEHWVAQTQVGSLNHDLCILTVPGAELPRARTRPSEDLRTGEPVIAAGFQSGSLDLVVSRGTVAALYRYDDGQVIRTTASFDLGSSGGGLFDQAGNLVGLLAFKGRTGENLRFALPSEWMSPDGAVSRTFARIEPTSAPGAFWERPPGHRPAFLGVAMREAAWHPDGYPDP